MSNIFEKTRLQQKIIENIRINYNKEMAVHKGNHKFISPHELETIHDTVSSAVIAREIGYNLSQQSSISASVIKSELRMCFEKYVRENKMNLNWDGKSNHQVAIGIDLGTCNCVVAVYHDGNVIVLESSESRNTTPSYVSIHSDGSQTIGRTARSQMYKNTKNTFYDIKRLIGRKPLDKEVIREQEYLQYEIVNDENILKVKAHDELYLPENISALLLAELKRFAERKLGCSLTKAVITVPAYFNDNQKKATIRAGEIAGFEVLNILSEPKAAAIAYKLRRYNDKAKRALIFDLGGGTFDVAVLNTEGNNVEVLSYGGDTHLGGHDFDNKLFDHCIESFITTNSLDCKPEDVKKLAGRKSIALLQVECERVKKSLSGEDKNEINVPNFTNKFDLEVEITREEYEAMIIEDLDRMIQITDQTLKDAKTKKQDIDDIILVGGATLTPKLQAKLSEYFNRRALNFSIRPDEAVAYGAAVEAALLNGQEEAKKLLRIGQDVTSISYGIEINFQGIPGCFAKIISKNTKFPARRTGIYFTSYNNQTEFYIRVYQGEAPQAFNNCMLGEFELSGVPPAPAGQQRLTVIMQITSLGILHVEGICQSTMESKYVTLNVAKLH